MIQALQEQLISIDELRTRMPDLRARETNLRNQIQALDTQLADRDAYLKLAHDLEGFLSQLRSGVRTADVPERQRVLRLLVKDVLAGPDKIVIRHRIPIRERASNDASTDTEGEHCQVRWGREDRPLRGSGGGVPKLAILGEDAGLQERLHQSQDTSVRDSRPHPIH